MSNDEVKSTFNFLHSKFCGSDFHSNYSRHKDPFRMTVLEFVSFYPFCLLAFWPVCLCAFSQGLPKYSCKLDNTFSDGKSRSVQIRNASAAW